jgi:Tfp pilus assembly protein PilF
VVVCWFAVLTDRQIPVWADQGALWAATVQAAPGSVRANHNLAGVLLETGDIDGARRALARARRNDPRYAPAYLGQALIDCTGGRPVRGRRFIERARARGADPAEAAAVAETCAQAARSDHR